MDCSPPGSSIHEIQFINKSVKIKINEKCGRRRSEWKREYFEVFFERRRVELMPRRNMMELKQNWVEKLEEMWSVKTGRTWGNRAVSVLHLKGKMTVPERGHNLSVSHTTLSTAPGWKNTEWRLVVRRMAGIQAAENNLRSELEGRWEIE